MNCVQRVKLYFYVRGSGFTNISLLLFGLLWKNRAIPLGCDVIMKELTYFVRLLGQSSNCGESHPALLDCHVIVEEITLFGWIVAEKAFLWPVSL